MRSGELDVGTIVHFMQATVCASPRDYRIEQLVLLEGGVRLYRIKSDAEPFDRIVAARDLALPG